VVVLHFVSITVIETHPENTSDLRLDVPFPPLLEYITKFDFDKMDSAEHGHVPFVVVLQHYLQVWKASVRLSVVSLRLIEYERAQLLSSSSMAEIYPRRTLNEMSLKNC
jgi:hypothetical protein